MNARFLDMLLYSGDDYVARVSQRIDVNLDGEQVYPAAELLLRREIPFIFSTGYDSRSALPEGFRGVRALQKPFGAEALLQALREALAPDGQTA